jgi:hypothetical protein
VSEDEGAQCEGGGEDEGAQCEGGGEHDHDYGHTMPDDATLTAFINDPVMAVRGPRFATQEPPKAASNVISIWAGVRP